MLLQCAAAVRAASMLSAAFAVFVWSGVGLLAPRAGWPTPPASRDGGRGLGHRGGGVTTGIWAEEAFLAL